MSTYHSTGIVLKITDHQEADQLFSIYTKEHGKVVAWGRGAKKLTSKLRGHLEPFGVVEVMIAHGRVWDRLAGAQVERRFSKISESLGAAELAFYGLELVDRLTQPGVPDAAVFGLLERYLTALNEAGLTRAQLSAYRAAFGVKLLDLLGFTVPAGAGASQVEQAVADQLEGVIRSKQLYPFVVGRTG